MIFQQFLILLVLTPVAGAMSVAAYAVVGEKQARTLEPLLATPITTFELLAAKVLGALIPGIVLVTTCFALYVGGCHRLRTCRRLPDALLSACAADDLPAWPAGGARRVADGRLRVVARQRRAQRAANRRARHPADQRAARRGVHQQFPAHQRRDSSESAPPSRRSTWR
jgi:hypothetical protein